MLLRMRYTPPLAGRWVGLKGLLQLEVVEGLLQAGAMPGSHRQYVLREDVERRDEQRAILNEMEKQNHVVEVLVNK